MRNLFISVVALSIILSGCTFGGNKEKQAFIDATIEATCMILQSENIFDPALEAQAKDIYKKYGFDADDDAKMEELTRKYENDEEVQQAVGKGIEECSGDFEQKFREDFERASEEGLFDVSEEELTEGEYFQSSTDETVKKKE